MFCVNSVAQCTQCIMYVRVLVRPGRQFLPFAAPAAKIRDDVERCSNRTGRKIGYHHQIPEVGYDDFYALVHTMLWLWLRCGAVHTHRVVIMMRMLRWLWAVGTPPHTKGCHWTEFSFCAWFTCVHTWTHTRVCVLPHKRQQTATAAASYSIAVHV